MTLLPPPPSPPPSRSSHPWRWVGLIVAAIIAIAFVALWLLLHSGGFHRYLVRTAESHASAALGAHVHIGSYTLQISGFSPSVDIYDITVAGSPVAGEPTPAPPLLHIPHAHLAIRITSLLHRSWQLESVLLDHPVVYLLVNAQGLTNLPTPPAPAQTGNAPNIFQLGIRRAAIHQGEVLVNDYAQPFTADLQGVQLAVAYQLRSQSYTGQLSYVHGQVQVRHSSPIPTTFSARFTASRKGIAIPYLQITAAGSQLSAHAELTSYTSPSLNLSYQAQLDIGRLRALLHQPVLPTGLLASTGTASYAHTRLQAHGRFSSSILDLRSAQLSARIRNLGGSYDFTGGTLSLSGLHAAVLGGTLAGSLAITDFGQPSEAARTTFRLHGAQLGQVARLARQGSATLQSLGITGALDATAGAHWRGSLQNLVVTTQLVLAAQLAGASHPVPLHLAAQASYDARRGQISLLHTTLAAPSTTLNLFGALATRISSQSQLHLLARSNDLAALEALASRIGNVLAHPLPPLALAGQGSLQASIHGGLSAPQVAGRLALANLSLRGSHWTSLTTQFVVSPSQAAVHDFHLAAPRGHIQLTGSIGLNLWQPQAASPLQLDLVVDDFPIVQIAHLLPRPLPLTGVLQAHVQAAGTLEDPRGQAQARLSPVRLQLGAGAPRTALQALTLTAQAAAGSVNAQLDASLAAGAVHLAASFHPATRSYSAKLSAPVLVLAKIPALAQSRLPLTGTITLQGNGQGTLSNPSFEIKVASNSLTAAGQSIHNLQFHVLLHAQSLEATLAARVLQTALAAQARIALQGDWLATASLDAPAIPLVPLLSAWAPQAAVPELIGATAVQVRLNGPLRRPSALQVDITVPTFELRYNHAWQLASQGPMHAHLAAGVLQLQPARLVGTDTDLQAQARIPIPALGANGPMQATLTGTVNLKLAQIFTPNLTAGGQLQLHITAAGALPHPEINGEMQISQASFSNPAWPVSLDRGQGTLRLHQNRVDLSGFTASVGGGTMALGGGFDFSPKPQFNLSIAATQVRLRYPPSLRDTIGADLTLAGSPVAALLAGRVRIEDVAPAPGFDFATLTTQLAKNSISITAPNSFLRNLQLQLAVTTPNQINITSRDFTLGANATLNIRGTAQEPVVLGRVALTSGDLIFRGNRYVIQSGTLDFVNPIRTVPTVNLTADTTIQQYNLHLRFQGPTDNLRASYTSDPALPPADIINLLAFGQTTEAGVANSLPGNLGAESIVAGAVSSQITDRIQKIAGISHLSVDPVLGGGQQNAGARITIQQRVTGNLFVTVSTDVTSTQRNVIEVQYHFSPRISVSGIRKQNGGFGINLQFKKTWH